MKHNWEIDRSIDGFCIGTVELYCIGYMTCTCLYNLKPKTYYSGFQFKIVGVHFCLKFTSDHKCTRVTPPEWHHQSDTTRVTPPGFTRGLGSHVASDRCEKSAHLSTGCTLATMEACLVSRPQRKAVRRISLIVSHGANLPPGTQRRWIDPYARPTKSFSDCFQMQRQQSL